MTGDDLINLAKVLYLLDYSEFCRLFYEGNDDHYTKGKFATFRSDQMVWIGNLDSEMLTKVARLVPEDPRTLTLDSRYSIGEEGTGDPARPWVARFCGDFLGSSTTREAAIARALLHEADRNAMLCGVPRKDLVIGHLTRCGWVRKDAEDFANDQLS